MTWMPASVKRVTEPSAGSAGHVHLLHPVHSRYLHEARVSERGGIDDHPDASSILDRDRRHGGLRGGAREDACLGGHSRR